MTINGFRLVRAGLPRPLRERHWKDARQHGEYIDGLAFLAAKGWLIVRVSATQLRYQRDATVERTRIALRQRGFPG
jgi:very-short-patch-repair endonuclease